MAMTVNMHEAKTKFSKLVQLALDGEDVIVAKAGKAVVRLTPVREKADGSWIGSLEKRGFSIPDDFNEMGRVEIEKMFYGEPDVVRRKAPLKTKRRVA